MMPSRKLNIRSRFRNNPLALALSDAE